MAEIKINIKQVQKQVDRLEDAAYQLKQEINTLGSIRSDIGRYWQGQSADIFQRKLEDRCSELSNLRQKILSVAETIEQTAERIRKEEEELEKKAQKL